MSPGHHGHGGGDHLENPRMSDGNRGACICDVDRPSNDELAALMAAVVKRHKGAIEQLHVRVRPLVIAFCEGQIQAGRLREAELETLVHETLWAVYQRRASFDGRHPFRAWLLQVARGALVERGLSGERGWGSQPWAAVDDSPDAQSRQGWEQRATDVVALAGE
jgi:RNA polymerase sigma-70 factor (ECF subfamily)